MIRQTARPENPIPTTTAAETHSMNIIDSVEFRGFKYLSMQNLQQQYMHEYKYLHKYLHFSEVNFITVITSSVSVNNFRGIMFYELSVHPVR